MTSFFDSLRFGPGNLPEKNTSDLVDDRTKSTLEPEMVIVAKFEGSDESQQRHILRTLVESKSHRTLITLFNHVVSSVLTERGSHERYSRIRARQIPVDDRYVLETISDHEQIKVDASENLWPKPKIVGDADSDINRIVDSLYQSLTNRPIELNQESAIYLLSILNSSEFDAIANDKEFLGQQLIARFKDMSQEVLYNLFQDWSENRQAISNLVKIMRTVPNTIGPDNFINMFRIAATHGVLNELLKLMPEDRSHFLRSFNAEQIMAIFRLIVETNGNFYKFIESLEEQSYPIEKMSPEEILEMIRVDAKPKQHWSELYSVLYLTSLMKNRHYDLGRFNIQQFTDLLELLNLFPGGVSSSAYLDLFEKLKFESYPISEVGIYDLLKILRLCDRHGGFPLRVMFQIMKDREYPVGDFTPDIGRQILAIIGDDKNRVNKDFLIWWIKTNPDFFRQLDGNEKSSVLSLCGVPADLASLLEFKNESEAMSVSN